MIYEDWLEEVKKNSYKNFHTKGLHYICVHRSPIYTVKYYFFEGDVTKIPEVVNPHDHRYDFITRVFVGDMSNHLFKEVNDGGAIFNKFEYMTPLNGGDGFTFANESQLKRINSCEYVANTKQYQYQSNANEIHTIQMHSDECLLQLQQFKDVVDIDVPTFTYCLDKEPPCLDNGLYEKFTTDELIDKINIINKHVGYNYP